MLWPLDVIPIGGAVLEILNNQVRGISSLSLNLEANLPLRVANECASNIEIFPTVSIWIISHTSGVSL